MPASAIILRGGGRFAFWLHCCMSATPYNNRDPLAFTSGDPRIQPIPESGCWVWILRIDRNGYGRIKYGGRNMRVHRVWWMRNVGLIPDGMVIDHMCRERACVNPSHLRLVTGRQNTLENSFGVCARNKAKPRCPRCGGDYKRFLSRANRWGRRCLSCEREHQKIYRDRRRERG